MQSPMTPSKRRVVAEACGWGDHCPQWEFGIDQYRPQWMDIVCKIAVVSRDKFMRGFRDEFSYCKLLEKLNDAVADRDGYTLEALCYELLKGADR